MVEPLVVLLASNLCKNEVLTTEIPLSIISPAPHTCKRELENTFVVLPSPKWLKINSCHATISKMVEDKFRANSVDVRGCCY